MAILSRRSIQRLIDESAQFLKPEQIGCMVGRLNNTSKNAVADVLVTEWELIVLSALAAFGQVEHETGDEGRRRVDVGFVAPSGNRFTADVRLLSDANAEQENPVRALHSELLKRNQELSSYGIKGTFSFRVGSRIMRVEGGRSKPQLSLPARHDFKRYVFSGFREFVDQIIANPTKVHHLQVWNDKADLAFVFNPGAHLSSASHLPYQMPSGLEFNIVYNALKKKSTQVKDAGAHGPPGNRGVILCDGGCALLQPSGSGNHYSAEQIIFHFLAKHKSTDFVCIVDVRNDCYEPYLPPRWRFGVRVFASNPVLAVELESLFLRALDKLPRPVSWGRNAFLRLEYAVKEPQFDPYRYDCGRSMSGQRITFSSRALLDFITGRSDREQFMHAAGFDFVAQIARMMDAGNRIESIVLSPNDGKDDDCIEFTFGDLDPSIAPFRPPTE